MGPVCRSKLPDIDTDIDDLELNRCKLRVCDEILDL